MRNPRFVTLLSLVPLCALLTACPPEEVPKTEETGSTIDTGQSAYDGDGDGVTVADGDCDDENADVYPGRTEDCNGVDDNCNDMVDEGFGDADEDGIADCEDTEECDGLDNDGDGEVDEDFSDADGDGTADCADGEECDGLDNDGDGDIDEGYDVDGDGYTQCGSDDLEPDCDDTDDSVFPGAEEVVGDGIDNDCDNRVDEGNWVEGDVFITEVMSNPGMVSDANGEWFEVYNGTTEMVYLNGLEIYSSVDGDYHQVESDELLWLEAGEYFVFGNNDQTIENGLVEVGYVYTGITLSNEDDDLILVMDGVTLDDLTWDDGLTMPDPDGASISLDPWYMTSFFNNEASSWCAALDQWDTSTDAGSPGAENELCSTIDHDFDGYSRDEGDCDDDNDTVYPGAPETEPTLDNDCDGDIEWMPVADASYDEDDSTLLHCDTLYLDGSDSYDPELVYHGVGSELTYDWSLDSVPADSSTTVDDITDSDDESPTFIPDVPGDYSFSLVVDDGGVESDVSELNLTIAERTANSAPAADAGSDESYEEASNCQAINYGESYSCAACEDYDFSLSATGSTDADSDWMTYAWSVTSGSATLDDSTSDSPTLTFTGPSATYGSDTVETVEVELTATDCYGDSGTDTVTLTFTCTTPEADSGT